MSARLNPVFPPGCVVLNPVADGPPPLRPKPRPAHAGQVLLTRPRLHAQLDSARGGLAWIWGPGGIGKSSLMQAYLHGSDVARSPVLWFALEAADADPALFFLRLRQAVQRRGLRLPAWRESGDRTGLGDFARRYFRAWVAALPPGVSLVFDDCQAAGNDSALPTLLDQLLLLLPPGCRVLAASREPLPLGLHRWSQTGRCTLVGWDALRAGDDEVRALACLWQQPAPGPGELVDGGGWLAAWGARFAAAWRQQQQPAAAHVFAQYAGAAYWALDPLLRQLLLTLARNPWLDEAEAAMLSGVARAGEALASLWRERWFIERRLSFDGSTRYAVHPMLRSYLTN